MAPVEEVLGQAFVCDAFDRAFEPWDQEAEERRGFAEPLYGDDTNRGELGMTGAEILAKCEAEGLAHGSALARPVPGASAQYV